MPKLLDTRGEILDNDWLLLDRESGLDAALGAASNRIIVPLQLWLASRDELKAADKTVGVWLDSDEAPDAVADAVAELPLIALNFPKFMDGRAYSSASILRRNYGFGGELRAVGEVLRDQLFYMRRCGFNTFDLDDSVDVADAQRALADFADSYQSTVEQPAPLFRRRSA